MENFDIHLLSIFTLLWEEKKFHMIHMDAFYLLPNLMVTNGTQHLGPIIQKFAILKVAQN
jgi:hypothetical protein